MMFCPILIFSDMLRTIILLCTLATMTFANQNGMEFTEMKSTTGIIFVPFTQVQLSYKEWKLIYYYDLDRYYEETLIIEHFFVRLGQICTQLMTVKDQEMGSNCQLAVSHARYHFEKILEDKDIIDSYNSATIRKRRSPFNFVGTLAHSLFGVLDQDEADKYNAEIEKLKNDQNYQGELIEKQILISERLTEATNNSLGEIVTKLNTLDASLNNFVAKQNWSRLAQNFNTMASTLTLILMDHDRISTEIKTILSHALRGEIVDLIPIGQLTENLGFINDKIARDEELAIEFNKESPYNIFKTATIHSILRNKMVIIEVGLPILSLEVSDIFKAIPIPTRVGGEYMMILPSSNMFITNADKSQYIPLSEEELKQCIPRGGGKLICRQMEPIHNGEENVCELTLLAKPYMNVLPRNCAVKSVPAHNYFIYLHEVNKFFCVIDTPTQFQCICPHSTDAIKLETTGIMTIREGCYLKNERFIIKSHSISRMRNSKIINPKFDLANIVDPKNNMSMEKGRRGEIFIKNHFSEFNTIAEDISKLRKDRADQIRIREYESGFAKMKFSIGGLSTFIVLATIVAVSLKLIAWRKIRSQKEATKTDLELKEVTINDEPYAEVKRKPTPFARRSYRLEQNLDQN